jgi:3-oxoacyl-[acyl-carrier-protein] synthase-3
MKTCSRFESIGVKIPEKRLPTHEMIKKLNRSAINKFELLTGIKERRICSGGEDSFTLARDAAVHCLSRSRYSVEDLDMILCCSISKFNGGASYQYEPPLSLSIKNAIGAVHAVNFDVTNACAGMLTGVCIADRFIQRGTIRSCMVVSGEFITSLCDHASRSIRTLLSSELASLTVGDAGAAVILERAVEGHEGIHVSNFTTLPRYNHLCTAKLNRKFPGFIMKTKARQIHRAWISESVDYVKIALEKNGLSLDQVDYIIPHQTSRSAIVDGIQHYASTFGVKPKKTVINLKEYGNTASTTHFLALNRFLEEKRFKRGDRLMMLCSASGLIIGVVLFVVDEIVERYERED